MTMEDVYNTVKIDLPDLKDKIESIIGEDNN